MSFGYQNHTQYARQSGNGRKYFPLSRHYKYDDIQAGDGYEQKPFVRAEKTQSFHEQSIKCGEGKEKFKKMLFFTRIGIPDSGCQGKSYTKEMEI